MFRAPAFTRIVEFCQPFFGGKAKPPKPNKAEARHHDTQDPKNLADDDDHHHEGDPGHDGKHDRDGKKGKGLGHLKDRDGKDDAPDGGCGPVVPNGCDDDGPKTLILGSRDGDILFGTGAGDRIIGLSGDDWIAGGAGADILLGRAGNDELYGGACGDTLKGGARA